MTKHQFWLLHLAEPLASRNEDLPHSLCSTSDVSDEALAESWGVTTAEEMASTLDWLETSGHREKFRDEASSEPKHAYLAWDLSRLAQLCRWGVRAGLLDVPAAWKRLESAGALAADAFPDWNAYLDDYERGYQEWSDDPEETLKVADAVREVKARSLPSWNPAPGPVLSPLKYRWRSFNLKLPASTRWRLVAIGVFAMVASIMQPWPLGAACFAAVLAALALRSKLWGPTMELLVGLLGAILVGGSFVAGYFRDALPESSEMTAAAILFGLLAFYLSVAFIVYSDDRTPAP